MAKKKTIETATFQTIQRTNRDITGFLNKEYRDYAKYVIETRALPSIIDGFKVGARKIMHAALNGGMKTGKEIKNLNLVGDVYNLTLFNHGDASLHGTIFTLSQFFKDNLNPLAINGQCGTLRDEDAVSAPRYLHVKHSKYAKLYKIDSELLEYVFDEGAYLEPVTYLPIIPTVLTSRTSGMAPGFAFSSFSYNPLDIIDACIDVLGTGKVQRKIRPHVRGIQQHNFQWSEDAKRWINYGEYNVDLKNDVLYITDLPYDVGYDRFDKQLNKLLDSGYIKDWKDYSEDENINYWIIFPKGKLQRELMEDRIGGLIKRFMLKTVVPENNLTVLDENGKVRVFNTEAELIEYFVPLRLAKYADRKSRLVTVKEKQLKENTNLCEFIRLVTEGKIVVIKRSKADIKKDLDKYNLPYEVLNLSISRLTNEEREELLRKNEILKDELEYIKNTSIGEMYMNDLIDLHHYLEGDF